MVVQAEIEQKITQYFQPSYLELINESNQHNVPAGSESHFKLIIVSHVFDGLRLLQRHREVNAVLAVELSSSVHALTMHTYTPDEWQGRQGDVPVSPACRGG